MSPLVKERLLTTLQYGIPLGLVLALFVGLATPSKRYEVLCEKRDGQRAVQVVRTHIRDHLADVLGRGGGHNQLDIRYLDGEYSYFLTTPSKTHNSDPNLLRFDLTCALSNFSADRFFVFQEGELLAAFGRTGLILRRPIGLLEDHGYPGAKYLIGGQPLQRWITRALVPEGDRLIAVQVATSADRVAKARAMPGDTVADDEVRSYAGSYAEQWAYGDVWRDKSLRVDYKRYPDLAPVVERRLVSTDDGKTWSLLDWRLLRPEVVPAGAQLQRIEPPQQ